MVCKSYFPLYSIHSKIFLPTNYIFWVNIYHILLKKLCSVSDNLNFPQLKCHLSNHTITDLYMFRYSVLWKKRTHSNVVYKGGDIRNIGHDLYSWPEVKVEGSLEKTKEKAGNWRRETWIWASRRNSVTIGEKMRQTEEMKEQETEEKQKWLTAHTRGRMRIRYVYKLWKPTVRCFLGRPA